MMGRGSLGVFLACLDDAWSIGFTGSYGEQWDEFVASVERGGFVDEGVNIPPGEVPFVLYKIGGGLPGRADWRLGSVEARAAATVVLWIGMTKVNFQVSLDVTESERLLAGTPLGGDLSVTLTDGKEPWVLTEMPPFADVTAFFLEHDCGKKPE